MKLIKAPRPATVVECFGSWSRRKHGEHAQNKIGSSWISEPCRGLLVGLYLFLFFDHRSLTSLQISVSKFWGRAAKIQCIHMHSNQSNLECWFFNLWSHWRVNKLEPIEISASISSSLFSVLCGMSSHGFRVSSSASVWSLNFWKSATHQNIRME